MRRLLLSLALLLPLVAALGLVYWWDRTKEAELTYQGMTVEEWQEVIVGPYPYPRVAGGAIFIVSRPPLWQRLGESIGLLTPHSSVKVASADEHLANPRAVPVLIALLDSRKHEVRVAAALWLGRIHGQSREAIPRLKKALEDPDEIVRNAAGIALERIKEAHPEE